MRDCSKRRAVDPQPARLCRHPRPPARSIVNLACVRIRVTHGQGGVPVKRRLLGAAQPLVAALALGCCGALFLTLGPPAAPRVEASSSQAQTTAGMSDEERLARATCSTCHNFSPPDVLPKDAW